MLGVEGVVRLVLARLQDALPAKLAQVRDRYGAQEWQLPDVPRFISYEPESVAIDQIPMIAVYEVTSDAIEGPSRVSDDGGGGTLWRYRYGLTLVVWARGADYEQTADARRRYTLAVREVLLQRPGLGDPDPGECVLLPNTLVESYSAYELDEGSRAVAAATGFEMQFETQEYLPAEIPGVAAQWEPATIGVEP